MRRSREQISAIVSRWPSHGLNVVLEAKRHGVGVATIHRWRKLADGSPSGSEAAEFLEVSVPPSPRSAAPTLRLCWPDGFTLEWMCSVNPETTASLLRSLGRA